MGFTKNVTKVGRVARVFLCFSFLSSLFFSKEAPAGAAKPQKGQNVTVHCTGIVKATGKKFWSTKDPGQKPFSFDIGLGNVIKGWDEGVMTMALGESADLECSPDYGCEAFFFMLFPFSFFAHALSALDGAGGFPAWGIPPNAVLIFQIEVLSIK